MVNMKNIIYSLLIFCICSFSANAKLFGAKSFELDNGLKVIVIENHKAPIIKHMIWYQIGAVDEAEGKGGTAHLLEHLMFRGTSKVSGEMFDNILKQNGVESNAFTSLDFTAYHHSLDISKLELVMALEADRMQNLKISPENFALERDIVYQERKQMVDNNPAAAFSESYRKILWQEHPYHRSVSGQEREIKNLTIEDVTDFYNKFYVPNNAILILSGDIDISTAKLLAQKYYGDIEPRPISKKANFGRIKTDMQTKLEMSLPQINAVRLVKTYIAPSFNENKSEIYNLAVFSKYLGEGETSELYKELVLKQKKALAISSSYDYVSRSYGKFIISALPAADVSAEELEQAINETVEKAIKNLSIDKMNKIKNKMLAGLVYFQDNPLEAADMVGAMSSVGMGIEDIENHAEHIRQVSYQDIKDSAIKLKSSKAVVTGILKPKGEN